MDKQVFYFYLNNSFDIVDSIVFYANLSSYYKFDENVSKMNESILFLLNLVNENNFLKKNILIVYYNYEKFNKKILKYDLKVFYIF
jgi:hypothetical protein